MSGETHEAPPRHRIRVAVALAVAVWAAFTAWRHARFDERYRDFDQLWWAARAIVDGRNPYAEICPGCVFDWTHFYYPLTAAVAALPVAWLPRALADAAFAGLAAGALAWVLSGRGWGPLLGLTSPALLFAVETVQWSPLLAASAGIPLLAVFYCAKPTVSLALFAAWPRWTGVVGGLAILAVSLLLQPDWPWAWRDALGTTALDETGQGIPYIAPVMLPGGFLALLALLRWRRPEARLVAVLACIPQTLLLYEAVPLLLVPRSWKEALLLVAGGYGVVAWTAAAGPFDSRMEAYTTSGLAIVACCYLPAVALVLRRPNVGSVPGPVERWLLSRRAPAWLAGTRE